MITEERRWKRGQKQTYTDRSLTDEEREFAGTGENYKKLFEFMHYYKMDENEWYDILTESNKSPSSSAESTKWG